MLHPEYPAASEVDKFCKTLVGDALSVEYTAEFQYPAPHHTCARNSPGTSYVRFSDKRGCPWFGIWQPVAGTRTSPLLIHVPGYGGEMSEHPHLVAAGFNVLHVNPRGYCTPTGFDESKRVEGNWPVLPDTVLTCGRQGYVDWLTDAIVAARWAMRQPQVQAKRLAFFGTSQGGGTALLLASLMRDHGVTAVCADEPYLTGYYMMVERENAGAYSLAVTNLKKLETGSQQRVPEAWRALGFYDTLNHAHRLTMPTLLTAGGADLTCPPDTIRALFDRLPGTRSYTELAGEAHGYTVAFGELVRAWCTLYV